MTTKTQYIYRSIRSGEKVRRVYLGTLADPVVQTHQEFQRLSQATRDAEEAMVVADLEVLERVDACLRLIATTANRNIRRLRKRHRRARGLKLPREDMSQMHTTRDDYDELVVDAADGDEQALSELRRVLAANPSLHGALGDLNRHVQRHLIDLSAGDSVDTREALVIILNRKRAELVAGGGSLPEQMLIDLILSTMLDTAACQLGLSQPHRKESVRRRWEDRLTRAQSRHQAAILSLLEARNMLSNPLTSGETE